MNPAPRLLILSGVLPFPRNAGQQQRVYYKLRALRPHFHLTFLTVAPAGQVDAVRQSLLDVCDDALVLPSRYTRHPAARLAHKLAGSAYAARTGLKFSNYQYGELEFASPRLASAIGERTFDGVLFEYWHAFKAVSLFQARGAAAILDMHDVLWQSYARQLDAQPFLPAALKRALVRRYRAREEAAWQAFDALIAINADEYDYARQRLPADTRLFHVPMGTDIALWQYGWQPAAPCRVAYYGSLGSRHNQQDALLCYREIMPLIWAQHPEVEFWIVGSSPPPAVTALARDARVRVTGFLDAPQHTLRTMSLVLCPWSGTYGFRSRIVEVMALGVPVIASPDAIAGMGFETGGGILLATTAAALGACGAALLADPARLHDLSRQARQQVEAKFSYEATYAAFARDLAEYLPAVSPPS